MLDREIVRKVTRLEIVDAVDDDVCAPGVTLDIAMVEVVDDGFDLDLRVDAPEAGAQLRPWAWRRRRLARRRGLAAADS
jgi:hypothetical protein